MIGNNNWLLPEGVEEILPEQAAALEELCRKVIDFYTTWGYRLVIPPMIEYLESLLTGTGADLDLQTFKITDQLSGRLMGIRADTTPQVARIDAHILKQNAPSRLCYLGAVLHTRPKNSGDSRSPLQVGAEIYGHQGSESDAEILCLMLETLKLAGIENIHIDLGHVGIFQGLVLQAGLNKQQEQQLFDVLQRKSAPELQVLIKEWSLTQKMSDMLEFLIQANGDSSILKKADKNLSNARSGVKKCLDEIRSVTRLVQKRIPDAPLFFDLAELRGYHYHTGIVFAAYVPGRGQGIAFGGRYNDIGRAFGRSRPATGFSTDMKILQSLSATTAKLKQGIYAPCKQDKNLLQLIDKLRLKGEIVVVELPGQKGGPEDVNCNRMLVRKNGRWQIKKL